jgi:tagatose 6-phosphate kinase
MAGPFMILAVCLNPALQRTLHFQDLEFDRVNRAKSVDISTGGKGVNVARVASTLGADVLLLTLLGGTSGREVKGHLKQEGIPFQAVPVRGNTRLCSTLLDPENGTQTELVEESEPVTKKEVENTERAFEKVLPRCRLVILSGTAPKGFPDAIYGKWISMASRTRVPAILDAPMGLAKHGLASRPWLFKPNRRELEALLGIHVRSESEARKAMEVLRSNGAQNVLMTQDGPVALALTENGFFRIRSRDLKVVNPIGSGDSIAAGIGAAFLRGKALPEALRFGMACGGANVMTPLAGTVRKKDVRSLLKDIRMQPIIG